MTGNDSTLTDLVANAASARETVERRINRRLEVLREWLREGIPSGKSIPRSLREARVWEDGELGITAIASPNEFTTTHGLHGDSVRDIGSLLTELKKRFDRPSTKRATQLPAHATKFDRKDFDRQLKASVSQWHTERDQRLHEKRRADSADARSILLLEENVKKDALIADLQRQLSAHQGLKVVK